MTHQWKRRNRLSSGCKYEEMIKAFDFRPGPRCRRFLRKLCSTDCLRFKRIFSALKTGCPPIATGYPDLIEIRKAMIGDGKAAADTSVIHPSRPPSAPWCSPSKAGRRSRRSALLHHAAVLHHHDIVRERADDRQVMADEEIGEPVLRCRSLSSSMICFCTDRSSAEVARRAR